MSEPDRTEFEGYEALVSELRASPPVAPERLRERVLELAPGARSWMSGRRRLVLVVAPLAVVAAVGAALVHAFVSSGRSPRLQADAAALGGRLPHSKPSRYAPVQGKKALTQSGQQDFGPAVKRRTLSPLLAAGSTSHALDNLNTTAGESVVIPKNRLVHADASLVVKVGSHAALTKATNSATQIVSKLGGYAQSVQYQASRTGYGNAYLALRVPVGKAETAIGQLSNLGTLVSQQVSTQDLQQQLTKQTNQLGVLRRDIAVYEQALQSGTLSGSQRVEIEIKLQNAQHEVKSLRTARSSTLASGATADISLTLTTNKNAIVVGHHHKRGRFGRLLGSAAGFLGLEGIIVLYALIVISPLVLIGGLGWWVVRERRRREDRLLAST